MKLGDGGGGEEGLKRLGKRAAEEDALEGEGAGGGDAAEDGGGTKRDGKTPRGGGPPAPASGPQAPSPPPACPQDQHHFLRSSVRPQSKRLRKDSSGAGGSSSGPSGSGPRGKGTGDPQPLVGCAPRSPPRRHCGSWSRSCMCLALGVAPRRRSVLSLLPGGCFSLCFCHAKRQWVACLWANTIDS